MRDGGRCSTPLLCYLAIYYTTLQDGADEFSPTPNPNPYPNHAGRGRRVGRVTHRAAASAVDRVHVRSDGSGKGNPYPNHKRKRDPNPSPKVLTQGS